MKVNCKRCDLEGTRFAQGFKMSRIIHEWLCGKCYDILTDKFHQFKEDFIQPERLSEKNGINAPINQERGL